MACGCLRIACALQQASTTDSSCFCPLLCCAALPPPQAKRVLWGGVAPACDSSVMKMDYKQLRKYIKRWVGGCTAGSDAAVRC